MTWLFAFCLLATGMRAQPALSDLGQLRDCDLLFHVSPTDNAITAVTEGADQQKIDHVGIFLRLDGQPYVLEAIDEGVVYTPLDSVLSRKGHHLVGRVRGPLDKARTLHRAAAYVGRGYDHFFLPDNSAIYCSELVELSYTLYDGQKVFTPIPMTFTGDDGQILPYWQTFYEAHGMSVPEGHPGSNPGELSRRKNVRIKYVLYGFDK